MRTRLCWMWMRREGQGIWLKDNVAVLAQLGSMTLCRLYISFAILPPFILGPTFVLPSLVCAALSS